MDQMRIGKCIKRIFCILAVVLLLMLRPVISAQSAERENVSVQTVAVGIPVEERPELFLTRSMPTHGQGKIAVFLIDFPDYPNDNPAATREHYDKLYFSGGVNNFWGNITVAEFFEQESYGKLEISGRVFDWYTAKHKQAYYDDKKEELIIEAAQYYISQGVDFSEFDGDGDGTIDAITYHFAGESSTENQKHPWYDGICFSSNSSRGFGQIGGLRFTTMVQLRENADSNRDRSISKICHELMHALGMPDLYGEAYFGLQPGRDLMCAGEYGINPYTKMLLGWLDTVEVVTGQTDQIRLEPYGNKKPGDVVIVADSFDGLLDEFYVVAYRQFYQFTTPTIWHIDARINGDGTAFLCENQRYDPRPDKETDHSVDKPSPYLFIEELSAKFGTNYVILGDGPSSPEMSGFGAGSVLGPNSMPSSDTHDGTYTGICIHNFKEHNKEYVTFDVSFVEDTAAPVLTTNEDELKFTETITLKFNEYIYQGEAWENIHIMDLDGQKIAAKILRPHYPCNEIEITFQTDAYLDGYIINLPEGCVRDSSGNKLAALTVSATKEDYFFASKEEMLPNPGFNRNNDKAYFFPQEDSLVVITSLWEENKAGENIMDAKVEFMRLTLDGTVMEQKILDNPFEKGEIVRVAQTGDGCYIFICQYQGSAYRNLLFCMDQNGDIKWTNADSTTETMNYSVSWCQTKNGIRILLESYDKRQVVDIRSEDGAVECVYDGMAIPDFWNRNVMNLSDGKLLCQTVEDGKLTLQIVDEISHSVEEETLLKTDLGYPEYVLHCQTNADGTIMLYCYVGDERAVLMMDAKLNLMKAMAVSRYEGFFQWLPSGGFVDFEVVAGNHENNKLHANRYDRYLNKIWESDVVANFVYYYETATGEIMAYRSMWEPQRECYIDTYGSEEKFETVHIHTLTHFDEIPSTCKVKGTPECWQCTDCGCFFSDAGQTVVTELEMLKLPLGDHSFGEGETIKEPTTNLEGIAVVTCTVCGGKEYTSIPKLPEFNDNNPTEQTDSNPTVIVAIAAICVVFIGVVSFVILKRRNRK